MFLWIFDELKKKFTSRPCESLDNEDIDNILHDHIRFKPWYERFAEFERKRGTNKIILDRDGNNPYLERFYLVNRWMTFGLFRIFIHRFWRSDDDGGAFHSHPWLIWGTRILRGGYIEHTPDGNFLRLPGDMSCKHAWSLHWVELFKSGKKEQECWTMFFVFPKIRSWGFKFNKYDKEIPWRDFLKNKLNKSKG